MTAAVLPVAIRGMTMIALHAVETVSANQGKAIPHALRIAENKTALHANQIRNVNQTGVLKVLAEQ